MIELNELDNLQYLGGLTHQGEFIRLFVELDTNGTPMRFWRYRYVPFHQEAGEMPLWQLMNHLVPHLDKQNAMLVVEDYCFDEDADEILPGPLLSVRWLEPVADPHLILAVCDLPVYQIKYGSAVVSS